MVKFIDLASEGAERSKPFHRADAILALPTLGVGERQNPNHASPFSIALSCYPISSQLARSLDLDALHALSRTCWQIRHSLLEVRQSLISLSLQCENEAMNPATRLGDTIRASLAQWTDSPRGSPKSTRLSGGRVDSSCARDLVGECRRCGRVVCRNCIVKPPLPSAFKDRLRRLCRTCMKSPIGLLTVTTSNYIRGNNRAPIDYTRNPCSCKNSVWICKPCGQFMRNADVTYQRGWAWRNRYSDCGGIGAGLGEGNEGVQCGRRSECLDTELVEREIECDAHDIAALEAEMSKVRLDGREWEGSSYTTHEIVGIGGRVKKKFKQTLAVGATVKEYENERAANSFLQRERDGVHRGWCSWCNRVIPGNKDLDPAGISTDSIVSHCSTHS